MTTDTDLAAARAQAQAARLRLAATLATVTHRLKPAALAHDALETATRSVASVARDGVHAVRARPLVLVAVTAGLGLFLSRGWIADIWRSQETPHAKDRSSPKHPHGHHKHAHHRKGHGHGHQDQH